MFRYETLFLTVPEITTDEASSIEKQLDQLVQAAKGNVISFERWGKYKLAYPVRKYEYGVYFLIRFEVPEEGKGKLLESIKSLFLIKIFDLVMRFTTQKLSQEGSIEYKRPESLEEAPARDVDTFLRENKMTGLMNKPGYHKHHNANQHNAGESNQAHSHKEQAQVESKDEAHEEVAVS